MRQWARPLKISTTNREAKTVALGQRRSHSCAIFLVQVQCYCTRLLRLSHKRDGDGVACVHPSQTRCPCAADRSPCVIATIGGETVTTDCSPSAEADDICKSLERAVLKYFPALAWRRSVSTNCSQSAEAEDICTSLERAVLKFFVGPIEDVDTFLFAEGDDSAVGDLQTACAPRPPTATDSQLTLFSAES